MGITWSHRRKLGRPDADCIFVGRRGVELATGKLAEVLQRMKATARRAMTGSIGARVDAAQRQAVLATAYQFLDDTVYGLNEKISKYTKLPFKIIALAHDDEEVAREHAQLMIGQYDRLVEQGVLEEDSLVREARVTRRGGVRGHRSHTHSHRSHRSL